MKINPVSQNQYQVSVQADGDKPKTVAESLREIMEKQDKISFSNQKESANALWSSYTSSSKSTQDVATSKPRDKSSTLTSRLVFAKVELQVQMVISDANTELRSLRLTAALGKGEDAKKAKAYIKRLEKILLRAGRKISDLRQEDVMQSKQKRAEQDRQQKRAEEIKEELKKKRTKRGAKENSYLLDKTNAPPTDAEIERQAQLMAAAEIACETASAPEMGGTGGAEASEGAAGPEGASAEGGSIDITV